MTYITRNSTTDLTSEIVNKAFVALKENQGLTYEFNYVNDGPQKYAKGYYQPRNQAAQELVDIIHDGATHWYHSDQHCLKEVFARAETELGYSFTYDAGQIEHSRRHQKALFAQHRS